MNNLVFRFQTETPKTLTLAKRRRDSFTAVCLDAARRGALHFGPIKGAQLIIDFSSV